MSQSFGMRNWVGFRSLFFGVFLCSSVGAQMVQPARVLTFENCEKERLQFCSTEKDLAAVGSCLIQHDSELSVACKEELQRFAEARSQASARSGGSLSGFGGLNAFGPPIPLFSYEGRMSPSGPPSFTENKANLSLPVYRNKVDTVALSLAGGDFHFGDPLTLSNGTPVAQNLYRIEVGAQFAHQLPEHKNWSVKASVGYAGDKPFKNAGDVTYSANATYGYPGSKNDFWVLFVFFSNNSSFLNYVPIPGFAYIYKTEAFSGMFGFPIVSMQWTPVYPWSFSLAAFGPTIQSEVAYGSIDQFQVFAGYYWTRQRYIPAVRPDDKFRLTIEEMKAALGARTPIWNSVIGEVQAGRAFDRSVYIGNGLSDRSGGSLSVAPDWYVSWSLKAKL